MHTFLVHIIERRSFRGLPLALWWLAVPTDHHDIGLTPFRCPYLRGMRRRVT